MPARPISSAAVSFGLVSVPVQLYSAAVSSANVSFNLLHKKCGSRLKQQYLCPKDGEKVERDDMVKGYRLPTGQFVQFTKEELKALEEKKTESINITEFVPLKEVDRIYLDKVYYLGRKRGASGLTSCWRQGSRRRAAPRWDSTPPEGSNTSFW